HRNKTGEFVSVCLKDDAGKDLTGNFKYQKALNKSAVLNQYQDIVLDGTTILGSQFTHGRVDAYHVRPDGRISKHPRRRTKEDVRGSPVGLASTPSAVYVAAGEFDRVQAFRVRRSDGMLAEETPFSQTNEQTGSFPHALAVATIPLSCFRARTLHQVTWRSPCRRADSPDFRRCKASASPHRLCDPCIA